MANHCSAPFSMRRIRDISSLTPGIQFCETRRERFCRGSEVESGIFHCAGLSWIRRDGGGVEGNTVGELADFLPLPQQCEKQRKEPKLFAKVGQPRKGRKRHNFAVQADLFASVTCSSSCYREARSVMHDHSIMVDYKEGPGKMRWGEKINAKNFKSNRAWSCGMDENNACCPVT